MLKRLAEHGKTFANPKVTCAGRETSKKEYSVHFSEKRCFRQNLPCGTIARSSLRCEGDGTEISKAVLRRGVRRLRRAAVEIAAVAISIGVRSERMLIENKLQTTCCSGVVEGDGRDGMESRRLYEESRAIVERRGFAASSFQRGRSEPSVSRNDISRVTGMIEAWASTRVSRPRTGPEASRTGGGVDFGGKRKNQTHESTTDPGCSIFTKSRGRRRSDHHGTY